ncbi:MAG: NTP transferase domain-containing protein [Bacteroides sp.]|nr:NTP transferase domain-containing protein [Bacteroides sp.]MCM1549114.1 NTP transferase domain-containing protein [Clostridium sp.]
MSKLKAVILAAGKGTRMKSNQPKVLHEIDGISMVEYVIQAAREAGAEEICLVVGHKAELVQARVGNGVTYVLQEEQLGTGHAVRCAGDFIGRSGDTMILCGDTPIITGATLKELLAYHRFHDLKVTVLSTILEDATGYGRIVRDENGDFLRIVEQKDASPEEQEIREINSGMYVFRSADLSDSLKKLKNDNVQKEYYLTDTIEIINRQKQASEGVVVGAMATERVDETRGVNTVEQLEEAASILRARRD